MLEAQDMFRTANKVTRPEKALILGFMAGSRGKQLFYLPNPGILIFHDQFLQWKNCNFADNPCPKLGNIVTVMLSENVEEVTQPDGTVVPMHVETHFQMNYTNGEWKRIKKNRRYATEESTSTTAASAQTAGTAATATASN